MSVGTLSCVVLVILISSLYAASAPAASSRALTGPSGIPEPTSGGTANISIHESGLPNGTTWWVAVAGTNHSGVAGQTFNFTIPGGTYNLTAGAEGNWSCGGVQVVAMAGYHVEVQVGCESTLPQPPKYSVVFEESGLPSTGFINWTVTLGGWIQPPSFFGSDLQVSFEETNGTYDSQVAAPGYNASPAAGTIDVVGTNQTIPITFTVNSSTSGCTANCTGWGPPLGGSPIAPPGSPGQSSDNAPAWVAPGTVLVAVLVGAIAASVWWTRDRRVRLGPLG